MKGSGQRPQQLLVELVQGTLNSSVLAQQYSLGHVAQSLV
jgi:hypothetical protein